jgi:hypothetical protein
MANRHLSDGVQVVELWDSYRRNGGCCAVRSLNSIRIINSGSIEGRPISL